MAEPGAVQTELTVVVPAKDEEARLPLSLEQMHTYLERLGQSYELILVDDGSHDHTLDLMHAEARRDPRVRVVSLPANRGKGRALAEGVAVSTGRMILVTDADLSAPLDELPKLERAVEAGAVVAIGSRARRGAVEVEQPVHRMLMGKTFNLMVQALLLPGIWDTQCGFKLFQGDAGRRLFSQLRTDGFAYDVEILSRARRARLPIEEVPVHWVHSAPTRVAPFRHSLEMIADIVRIRFMR